VSRVRFVLGLLLCFLCLWPARIYAAELNPYLDFAHSLYQEEDFHRAVTEARRFIFLHPDHARVTEAWLLLARSSFKLGQLDEAKAGFIKVISRKDRPNLIGEAVWELGRCLELLGPRAEAAAYYRGILDNPPEGIDIATGTRNKARYRLAWLLLEDGEWLESSRIFADIEGNHPLGVSGEKLSQLALEGQTLPLKNPSTAGVLSAILPGAGQLYAERPVDAALSFGLNAAFLWGTVEAYRQESWVVFTLLGLMELSWYGGNIYNAVNGAHIHNRELKKNFIKKIRREHNLGFGYSPSSQGPYLAWTIRF